MVTYIYYKLYFWITAKAIKYLSKFVLNYHNITGMTNDYTNLRLKDSV